MSHFPENLAFATQVLSLEAYLALRRALLDQLRQLGSVVVTEADLPPRWTRDRGWSEWTLLVTPATQALLVKPQQRPIVAPAYGAEAHSVHFLTAPQAVHTVIDHLLAAAPLPAGGRRRLQAGQTYLRDRCDRPDSDSHCADLLLSLVPRLVTAAASPAAPAEQSVQAALEQQVEQSLLLNQVVTKIRQSLDLPSILSTTVAEVRQFLAADRLLIYQFHPSLEATDAVSAAPTPEAAAHDASHQGYITYESLGSPHIASVKQFTEGHCFAEAAQWHPYLSGSPIAIDDVEVRYRDAPCLLNFLQKAQVRAKVIAPIVTQERLWGLLIAHHCHTPRHWQPRELIFLQHIAEQLAIAVQQAELYRQLQVQTQSLEACVINRTQELRDALAAAQSASRAKSEFLATMSHELRTPLTCIIGMSATLLRWSFGELSPRQRHYLTTIHESGERLLALINDILEMSKIESGRTVLEVRSFSLARLAQQTVDPFRSQARDRGIDLTLESTLLADQDTFIGDPRRMQQILENLLSNALKFTDQGGCVTVRVRREQQMAVLQVEDTGIGIADSQMPLLFEKFQQLETSRQRQYQGTGLGLALTKQLVELHGGTISVNSRIGVGSVFTVRLPLQRLSDRTPPLVSPTPAKTDPVIGRIVLVEDQDDTAGVICDLLTAADYQVIWMIEGSRVVEQVALLQPTVVIINLQISGIDGRRIIRALRNSLVTAPVKILAMNASSPPPELQEADVVLSLPIDPEGLLEQVNALAAMAVV